MIPINPKNSGPIADCAKACTEESTPERVRKVPKMHSAKVVMISTTFHDTFTKDQVRTNVAAATPLRREGQAKEVADLVTYLASPASSFVTGTSVDINGGMLFS